MKAIKILHIVSALGSGGVERLLLNIYKNLNRAQFQFDFITHYPEGMIEREFKVMGSEVYHLPLRRKHLLRCMKMIIQIFTSTDYDIIHLHGTFDMIPYLFLAFCTGKKIRICHSHTFFLKPSVFRRVCMSISRLCTAQFGTCFIACGQAAAQWGFGKRVIEKRDFHIVHNAINCSEFQFNSGKRHKSREQLGLDNRFTVLHVGRLSITKNQTFLLKVFAHIVEHIPTAQLLLVGEGELENELKRLTYEYGISSSVRFCGVRSDISFLMQASDVLALPSLNEGLPTVLIEAQMAGLPCIVSERISTEAAITSLLHFVPLDQPQQWSKAFINEAEHPTRRADTSNMIIAAGYDATREFIELANLYIQLCDKHLSRYT